MIEPGMFMVLAVGLMVWLAVFIPWVDMLESDRVVGLRTSTSSFRMSGRQLFVEKDYVVVQRDLSSVWLRAQLTGFPCSAGNHGGRAELLRAPRS